MKNNLNVYLTTVLVLADVGCISSEISDSLRWRLDAEILKNHMYKNVVVSAVNFRLPLCKLASVATGNTKNELLSTLGYSTNNQLLTCYTELAPLLESLRAINFIMFNRIFVNFTSDISNLFLVNNFGAQVAKVGFNMPFTTASYINRWVDIVTYKKIDKIIDGKDIENKMVVLIINAAYLKVTWETPFNIGDTKPMKFHKHDGNTSMVPMMSKTEDFFYYYDAQTSFEFVNTKLTSFGVSITFGITDNTKNIPILLKKMSEPGYLKNVNTKMAMQEICLKIPRFKIKSEIYAMDELTKIGIKQIFNASNPELNAILNQNNHTENIYVSKAKQKNFIDVDEMGIFRGPQGDVMRSDIRPRGGRQPKTVIAQRPFFFSVDLQSDISNRLNIHHLFAGVYYGPET